MIINKNTLIYILRQTKYLNRCTNSSNTLFWIFIDDENINRMEKEITNFSSNSKLGLIIRGKDKQNIYKRAKNIGKICKRKRMPYYVSTYPNIALSSGAVGVHYPNNIKFSKKYKNLQTSCSFHGLNEIRRVKNFSANRVFISPIFKTSSFTKKKPLGLKLLNVYLNHLDCERAVLGGIGLKNIRCLRNRNISSIGGISLFFKTYDKKAC